jgi:hypothetical protein
MLQVARTVAATSSASSIRIVAVAYADSGSAQSAPLEIVCEAAIASGAAGVLVDTRSKTGGHLFNWVRPPSPSAHRRSGRAGHRPAGTGVQHPTRCRWVSGSGVRRRPNGPAEPRAGGTGSPKGGALLFGCSSVGTSRYILSRSAKRPNAGRISAVPSELTL